MTFPVRECPSALLQIDVQDGVSDARPISRIHYSLYNNLTVSGVCLKSAEGGERWRWLLCNELRALTEDEDNDAKPDM